MVALGRKETASEERPRVAAPAAQGDLTPLRILLVEDNEKNRLLIQAFLKSTPCILDEAENGEIAVKKFLARPYDLVLMDIEMPVMDGYRATREIRKWESENRVKATPIIAVTAHALEDHAKKSLEAGCTAYLTKPIRKAGLLEAIEKYALKGKSEEPS